MNWKGIGQLFLVALFCGACSLALDTDVLQHKTDDANEGVDSDTVFVCGADKECDDGLDCTLDECDQDSHCVHLPNNNLCGELERCEVGQGCVGTGKECAGDSGCDDGVACTVDVCQLGNCKNVPDDSLCQNTQPFCRKPPVCHPLSGCQEGSPITCNAVPGICMVATCDPSNGVCRPHQMNGADDDEDGYLDSSCGGDDCDDTRAEAGPGNPEICDGADDNCDGVVDGIYNRAGATVLTPGGPVTDLAIGAGTSTALVAAELASTVVLFAIDGNGMATDLPLDMATLVSSGEPLSKPAVVWADGVFWVAAVVTPATGTSKLLLSKIDITDQGNAQITVSSSQWMDTAGNTALFQPTLLPDDQRAGQVLVAWQETEGAATVNLKVQSSGQSAATVLYSGEGTGGRTSLTAGSNGQVLVAFSGLFAGVSGGDEEVFFGVVANSPGWPVLSPIKLMSPADNDGVNDIDPSTWPNALLLGNGALAVVFIDNNGFDTSILWSDGSLAVSPAPLLVSHTSGLGNLVALPGTDVHEGMLFYTQRLSDRAVLFARQWFKSDSTDVTEGARVELLRLSLGVDDQRFADLLRVVKRPDGKSQLAYVAGDAEGNSTIVVNQFAFCTKQ